MIYSLTKGAESLLKEILDHRNSNGEVDAMFFCNKMEQMNCAEDDAYRSCFKELSDCDLVKIYWADGGPFMISLLSAGLEYFEQKKKAEDKEKKEKCSSRWHDIWVAAAGAVFGGITAFLLFKLFGIR